MKRSKISPSYILFFSIILSSIFLVGGLIPNLKPQHVVKPSIDKLYALSAPASQTGNSVLRQSDFKFVKIADISPTSAQCLQPQAIEILIDSSDSLQKAKLEDIQAALNAFVNRLTNNSFVTVDVFNTSLHEVVPLSPYQNNKNQFLQALNSLSAKHVAYTKDAFALVAQKLTALKTRYPNYAFNLVFFSAGLPETIDQYPTHNSDITQVIKSSGISVYAITLLDAHTASKQLDLMIKIASPTQEYSTATSKDLPALYTTIAKRILCK